MSGTSAISTTSRRELSSSSPPPSPAKQGAVGNSRHSDRNTSLFPSWSGYGLTSTPLMYPFFLSDYFVTWILLADIRKKICIHIYMCTGILKSKEIRRVVPCGRTDGQRGGSLKSLTAVLVTAFLYCKPRNRSDAAHRPVEMGQY